MRSSRKKHKVKEEEAALAPSLRDAGTEEDLSQGARSSRRWKGKKRAERFSERGSLIKLHAAERSRKMRTEISPLNYQHQGHH